MISQVIVVQIVAWIEKTEGGKKKSRKIKLKNRIKKPKKVDLSNNLYRKITLKKNNKKKNKITMKIEKIYIFINYMSEEYCSKYKIFKRRNIQCENENDIFSIAFHDYPLRYKFTEDEVEF